MPPPAPDGAHIVPEQLANLIAELKQKSDENKKRLEHIEKIEKEKAELEKQLRAEVKKNVDGNMPYADLVARVCFLFLMFCENCLIMFAVQLSVCKKPEIGERAKSTNLAETLPSGLREKLPNPIFYRYFTQSTARHALSKTPTFTTHLLQVGQENLNGPVPQCFFIS